MRKTLQLKKALTLTLLAFLGVFSAWADDSATNVLLDADLTQQSGTEGWTIVDKSTKTGTTWSFYERTFNIGNEYINAVRIARDWEATHNDYYISKGLELKAGTTYTLSSRTGKNSDGGSLILEVGTSLTDMSTYKAIKTLSPISTYNAPTDETITYTPEADGTYYFAFHAVQETSGSDYKYIFGFKVAAQGTGEAGGSTDTDQPGESSTKYVLQADFSTANPADWAIVDLSEGNSNTWNWNGYAFYDPAAYKYYGGMRVLQSTYSAAHNDYLISPDLQLKKGVTYTVTTASTKEKEGATLTLELGQSRTDVAGFTSLATLNPTLKWTDDRFETFTFTVPADGVYNLAYHLYEDPTLSGDDRKQKTYVFGLKVVCKADATEPEEPVEPETPHNPGDVVATADLGVEGLLDGSLVVSDKNGDDNSWTIDGVHDGLVYMGMLSTEGADEWLIPATPVKFQNGVEYTIGLQANQIGATLADNIEVRLLDELTDEAMPTSTLIGKLNVTGEESKTYKVRYSCTVEASDAQKEAAAETPEVVSVAKYVAFHLVTPEVSDGMVAVSHYDVTAVEKATPKAVDELTAEVNHADGNVALAWTAPVQDTEGCDITGQLGVKIYAGAELVKTIESATPGAQMTETITPAEMAGDVTYGVVAFIGEKESESVTTTVNLDPIVEPETPHEVGTVVLSSDLTLTDAINDYTVVDDNADNTTWKAVDGVAGISYVSDDASAAADDWFVFNTPVKFQDGVDYSVAFTAQQHGAFDPDIVEIHLLDNLTKRGFMDSELLGNKTVQGTTANAYGVRYSCTVNTGGDFFAPKKEGEDAAVVSTPKYVAIHISNPEGNGTLSLLSLEVKAIEKATPQPVSDLVAERNKNNESEVMLAWTNPTTDTDGYDIVTNLSAKVYENDVLVRTVDYLIPSATTEISITPQSTSGETTYKVVAVLGEKEAEPVEASINLDDATGEEVLVWTFKVNKTAANAWTILDKAGKGKWIFDYDDVFYFDYKQSTPQEDDWLISPMVYLVSSTRYLLKYELKTMLKYPSTIEVTIGNAATAFAQNQVVNKHEKLEQNGFAEFVTDQFSVPSDDQYCIGFHVTEANHGVSMRNLRVYGIDADPTVTGIDNVNATAEGVAYNKSTGKLIVPAGAKVSVYNANGALAMQLTASEGDINLNSLANGVYVVRVADAQGNVANCKITK